jgi:nucleotidyltransferase substrate binding protein (TIGR01987 family)
MNSVLSASTLQQLIQDLAYINETAINKFEIAAAVKYFEMTYEYAWKLLKRHLQAEGLDVLGSPKGLFRQAQAAKYLDNASAWFTFVDARNSTVHAYGDDYCNQVIDCIPEFLQEATKLCQRLKDL